MAKSKLYTSLEQRFRGLSRQTNKNIVVAYVVIKFYLGKVRYQINLN